MIVSDTVFYVAIGSVFSTDKLANPCYPVYILSSLIYWLFYSMDAAYYW